jgi:hypothetical protein
MTATTPTVIASPWVIMPVASTAIILVTMPVMLMTTATIADRRRSSPAPPNPVHTRSASTQRKGGHVHRSGARQVGDQETSTFTRLASPTRLTRGPVRGKGRVSPHIHRAALLRHTQTLFTALVAPRLAHIITFLPFVNIMVGPVVYAAPLLITLAIIVVFALLLTVKMLLVLDAAMRSMLMSVCAVGPLPPTHQADAAGQSPTRGWSTYSASEEAAPGTTATTMTTLGRAVSAASSSAAGWRLGLTVTASSATVNNLS